MGVMVDEMETVFGGRTTTHGGNGMIVQIVAGSKCRGRVKSEE
jgi:hypothetical protein